MKALRLRALAIAAAALVAGCSSAQPTGAGSGPKLNGIPIPRCGAAIRTTAYCGRLDVRVHRSGGDQTKIGLRLIVFPADAPTQLPPVFFLAGGPGGAATVDWLSAPQTFPDVHRTHDIVLLDQRGTGGDNKIGVPAPPAGVADPVAWFRGWLSDNRIGDLRDYGSAAAAEDIDQARSALGYGQIDLYGASYGVSEAQYYLAAHADHVAAAVLDSGTPLGVPLLELMAASSQSALDAVLDRCAASAGCRAAFPDPRADLSAAEEWLRNHPESPMAPHGLAAAIHTLLLSAEGGARVPLLLHRAAQGDLSLVASTVAGTRVTSGQLLMSQVIRCSERWAAFVPEHVAQLGAGSYYLAAQLDAARNQAAGCSVAGALGLARDAVGTPHADVSTLWLSGGGDPQDPPSVVVDARSALSRSAFLTIPYQGHTVGHLGCVPAVVAGFLASGRYDSAGGEACASTFVAPPFELS